MISTPRTEPIRHGVHLPQLSAAQNSIAKRAMRAHVGGVVEHRDAAVADQRVGGGVFLVVEADVELVGVDVGAERAADLHRLDRAAARGAAADVVDQLAQGHPERGLVTGRRA